MTLKAGMVQWLRVIETYVFDSQHQQSFLIRLWCAIHPSRD